MKKTILAIQPLLHKEMAKLENKFNILRLWESNNPEQLIIDNSKDIVGVVSTYDCAGVSKRLMEGLPNLEIITQYGVGFDNIDISASQERGIIVTNTPDVVTNDTADLALFLVLALARRAVEADMFVRVGRWQSSIPYMGTSVSGKTIGIVGLGKIGSAIASRADAFNMKVIYHSRTKKDVSYQYYDNLKEMASDCDFLVIALAANDETNGLIDYRVLDALGSKGYLINIARGSIVNEGDLLISLSNKSIAGAGLDVFADEPNIAQEIIKMDNVVLSPHVGGGTLETRSKMGQIVIDNLNAYFDGKPLLTPIKSAG